MEVPKEQAQSHGVLCSVSNQLIYRTEVPVAKMWEFYSPFSSSDLVVGGENREHSVVEPSVSGSTALFTYKHPLLDNYQ